MTIRIVTLITCSLLMCFAKAQFSFNGQYMNRAEFRNGFQTLKTNNSKPSFFISQRSRLSGTYAEKKWKMVMTVQDIRTWGNTSHLAIDNSGNLSIHEAYAELNLSAKSSLKMGRQELAYDEDRILGSLDWAMQARRHDVALYKYKDSSFSFHLGAAFNQDRELNNGTVYTVANNYKTFQFAWAKKSWKNSDVTFLFLNNGIQYSYLNAGIINYKTVYSQTFGARLTTKKNKTSFNTSLYFQTGKDATNKSLSAYNAIAEVTQNTKGKYSFTLGGEILSGTNQINTPTNNKSFTPLYGTNHKFNGYMDYFFVNNHVNSVGLQDYYFKILLKEKKYFVSLNTHFFYSNGNIKNPLIIAPTAMSKNLGTEIDLTTAFNISEGVTIQSGYSQMFGTETMAVLKNGNQKLTNNWLYTMVIIRPKTVAFPRVGLKF